MSYKINSYIRNLEDVYNTSITLGELEQADKSTVSLDHNIREVLRTVDFYTNSKYLTGDTDELGLPKPFFNVVNYRVTTAKVATDLDVADIRFESDYLTKADIIATMLINKELFKYLKEINFSLTLNTMGYVRPKYGGVIAKKYEVDGELMIDVPEWKNLIVDPVNIMKGIIIEKHYMTTGELYAKRKVWTGYDSVEDVIEAHEKLTKDKPTRIEITEATGEFNPDLDPDENEDEDYKPMCIYMARVGNKDYLLYKEEIDSIEDKYRYLPWEQVSGRSLGRGVVEDGFQSQVWTNDSIISMQNAMNLAGKVVLATTSKKLSGNAITDFPSGHILELEDGKTLTSLNLLPSAMPQFQNIIDMWGDQYNRAASTYDANTGEAPPSGTPYSQTALLNQVANSPFIYRREEWGVWLNEILNDWVLPHVKKRILKSHDLTAEYEEEELKMIDEAFGSRETKKMIKEKLLAGEMVSPEDIAGVQAGVKENLKLMGNRRMVKIPAKALDIEGRITANITGELKNKAATLQSLDNVLKTVSSSFNPQTGTFAILENPTMFKIFKAIVETAGIPVTLFQSEGIKTPAPQADLSAISPIEPNGTPAPTTV